MEGEKGVWGEVGRSVGLTSNLTCFTDNVYRTIVIINYFNDTINTMDY